MKFNYQYQISSFARIPNKFKEPLLNWLKPFKKKPRPQELIAETKRKGSPLYGLIESNDRLAAIRHRYERAQYILRHVEVVRINIKTRDAITKPVRAFIPVAIQSRGFIRPEDYIPSARVMDDPRLRKSVVERAEADLLAWIERYECYAEFFEVFEPVVKSYRAMAASRRPKKVTGAA